MEKIELSGFKSAYKFTLNVALFYSAAINFPQCTFGQLSSVLESKILSKHYKATDL